ncbi:fibrinogen-like protein A [Anopheles darlingi]|uniref:fibrinogen-like protein A n=1 Tax=Anopheles darlingi TaxID=43151 RepID=UPI0021000EE2|nr:fibrinogen-like protein A [Anopheles darlingi]
MKLSVYFTLICITFSNVRSNADANQDTLSANGVETLLRKLENIDRKLLELQNGQNELQNQIASIKASQEKTLADLSALQNQSLVILEHQVAAASHVQSSATVVNYMPLNSQLPTSMATSCKNVHNNASGVYLIRVNNDITPFNVFCEQEKFDGGWTVVQHRFNGSVDFNRDWVAYRDGFGDIEREFWLGLEKMHQITTERPHEIVIEMKDFRGNYAYARYNQFKIGSESEQYKITLGRHTGSARDSMQDNKNMKFSTKDRDNDKSSSHCAQKFEGAWWHKDCTLANLNKRYKNLSNGDAIYWYGFRNDHRGLSYTRMMIREI